MGERTSGQWESNVDDETDVGNIETSRCDICSYQDVDLALFESIESLESSVLAQIAVKSHDGETTSFDCSFKALCLLLVQGEDKDTGRSGG